MSRRRYVSTAISTDTAVNKLALRGGDFAALLYTWMIPHASDDATINGDPEELLMIVLPGRRDKSAEDIADALSLMDELELIAWDRDEKIVSFPACAFYKHQSYIKDGERRGANNTATPSEKAQNTGDGANQRKSAQKCASFKSSFSSSLTQPSVEENAPQPPKGERVRASPKPDDSGFDDWYAVYPRHVAPSEARKSWLKLSQDERGAALSAIRKQLNWPEFAEAPPDKIPHPTTWLNKRRWEDEPPKSVARPNGRAPTHGLPTARDFAEMARELERQGR